MTFAANPEVVHQHDGAFGHEGERESPTQTRPAPVAMTGLRATKSRFQTSIYTGARQMGYKRATTIRQRQLRLT